MTIEIRNPELEALIQERLEAGKFESVEEMLLHTLGGEAQPQTAGPSTGANRRLEKEGGVWVLHTGQPILTETVLDTLDAIRQERDLLNLGTLG